MTDKEKIRKEVQRLMNELIQEKEKGYGSDVDDASILELQNVLTYINSLNEEPVSVWHNMDEVPIKGEVIVVQTKDTFYGLSVQKGGTTYKNKNKDRYIKWAYASDLLNLSNVERTVKNWKEEPVSRTPTDIEAAMQEVEEKSKAFTEAHKGEDINTILAQMRGEPESIWHDANQQPTMYRKYLVRYSDGSVSGSWERHDDGFIPWEDEAKEHGSFTHWCYVEDILKL